MTEQNDIRRSVMDAIERGQIQMRPRWQFALISALFLVGVLVLFVTILYASSLAVFFMHDSGAWYAPSFGARGWMDLAHGTPWLLVLLALLFIVILETLVRKYAFVYRKPLLVSALSILVLVSAGTYAVGTSFHRQAFMLAQRGQLPPMIAFFYGDAMRPRPPRELYHGIIVTRTMNGLTMIDRNGSGTTTVVITVRTHLPEGATFEPGERIVVIGDVLSTGTIRAFGVQQVDD